MSASVAPVRRARWPWWVLGAFAVLATAGCIFVVLNGEALGEQLPYVGAFSMFGLVGAVIGSREPRNRIGWLLLWGSGTTALSFCSQELATYLALERDLDGGPLLVAAGVVGNAGWVVGLIPAIFLLPLLFPTGRPHSPRWRWFAWLLLAVLGTVLLGAVFATRVFTSVLDEPLIRNPLYVPAFEVLSPVFDNPAVFLALLSAAVLSQVMRFIGSSGVERQQIKWFAFAVSVLVAYLMVSELLQLSALPEAILGGIAFALLPATIGLSVLQYRLWDLDVVVKRALVAGGLVLVAVAVYAGAVGVLGIVAAGTVDPTSLFVVALALGIAFRPVTQVARWLADRLVYGRRATPYEVLTEFSERLGTSYGTEDVVPRMAQVLGEGTGAEVARVWLRLGSGFRPEASWPPDAAAPASVGAHDGSLDVPDETVVEVRDRGDVLGALSVRMPATEPMNPSKEKLVRDLASQAGLVLRNVRLVEELRASRQRLIAAQDEERRRLERDIHDGAQQQLVALTVKSRLARQLAERDPGKAAELLGQIERETQDALEDLRDLARGIYPPLLADRGLVEALRAQSRKAPIPVTVDAEGVGRYPADVEATVYFCALEALQNVAKYAEAASTTVRVAQADGTLSFTVVDDGRGFDPATEGLGSGLQGMADRLAAVGGSLDVDSSPGHGTRVAGSVPVRVG